MRRKTRVCVANLFENYFDVLLECTMVSLILGIILVVFTVFSVLPVFPLNWGADVINFLKGGAPVLATFLGLICLFIGAADIKDKRDAKREELEARSDEEK